MKLKGKVALVTGAGRGIGKDVAVTLAREGARVIVCDVNIRSAEETSGEIKAMGYRATPLKADVTDSAGVTRMVETIIKKFARIDILVNNAGVFSSVPLDNMTEDEWNKVMEVNLKGVFICSKAVMKFMKKQQSGKILNVASLAAKIGGFFAGANYAASKAGVISLTKSLAKQLAPFSINVNAVAPGAIETDMTRGWPRAVKKSFLKQIPLRRFGTPWEVAEAVLFLVSDSSSYITGATIDVNGGILMD